MTHDNKAINETQVLDEKITSLPTSQNNQVALLETDSSNKPINKNKASHERELEFEAKIPKTSENFKNKPADFDSYPYRVTKEGLFVLQPPKKKTKEDEDVTDLEPTWVYICSPIWAEAYLRNKDGKDHSLLLKMHDGEREHFWAMPKRLIMKINDINDVLLNLGQDVPLYPAEQKHLQKYLMSVSPINKMRCVDKSGWHGQQYIFPDAEVIGKGDDGEGVYPLNDICPRGIGKKGTLKEWQDNVLNICKGNSRLIFSIGAAFASLCLIDEDSGGFNFKGRSSIGKTKCLRVAISVIGSREYQRSWKTTANGLEGVCALHNDSLLPLDEFGQQDATEAGEIAYMVASGVGKQRASRDGSARDARTWRVLILSTGEVGLETHMREGRKKVRAGQLARITDIPADAGMGLGCFENVHNLGNGAEFADALDEMCSQFYGTAARGYIERIVVYGVDKARNDIRYAADDFVAEKVKEKKCDGQVLRVAKRFGLIYGALALAQKLGVTPELTTDESKEAVSICYNAWLTDRGTEGAMESKTLVEQVTGTLKEYAESKFCGKNDVVDEKRIRNILWGFRDKSTFFVFPKAFKEICDGYENAVQTLIEEGLLIPEKGFPEIIGKKSSQSVRISGHYKEKDRFYVINLDYEKEEAEDA